MMKLIQNSFKIFSHGNVVWYNSFCVCILLREKSSSHAGGSWFWLLKNHRWLLYFCFENYFMFSGPFGECIFSSCYRIKFMFLIHFGSKIKNILSCIFSWFTEKIFLFFVHFSLAKGSNVCLLAFFGSQYCFTPRT